MVLFRVYFFPYRVFFLMNLNLCHICSSTVYPGHGSLFVKNDMKFLWFCRSKCKKLFSKKKNPFGLRWTSINRRRRGIRLNNEKLNSSGVYENIQKFNEYNRYLLSYVMYLKFRFGKIDMNRSLDYKYVKKSKV
nr:60S ribosomal protein L24 [Cryptomonas sp.]